MKMTLPFKKKKDTPKQRLPINDIDDIIELEDKSFVKILKVTDPLNTDLLGEDKLIAAISSIQDCCNALNARAQILISSERIDIEDYLNYLRGKANTADDQYTLERIQKKIEYLESRSLNNNTVLNFYFSIKSQYKKIQDAYDELSDLSKDFYEYLKQGDILVLPLEKKQAMKMFYEKLNPNSSIEAPYTGEMETSDICPDSIRDRGHYLEMDDMYYSFFTFSRYPDKVEPSWLKRIMNSNASIDLSINLEPADKSKVIDATDKRIRQIEIRLDENIPPKLKKKYEKQEESLNHLLGELDNDSENTFDTTIICSVREKDLEELKSAESRLKTAFSACKLRSRKLKFKGTYLMWYNMPICYSNRQFERKIDWPMQSSTIGSILPFDSSELSENNGILKGFHANKEAPIIYNRYNKYRFNNPNECVLGEPGSGKSFYLQADMLRESTSGNANRLFVIDPEREFFLPNANRVLFKLGSEYATNVFHIRSTVLDSDNDSEDGQNDVGQYLRRKIGDMITFFKWIIPTIEERPTEKAHLIEAITHAYGQKGLNFESTKLPDTFPTLSNLKESLIELFGSDGDWLIDSLYAYIDGPYSSMFNAQTNWGFDSKVTVMDIHELSEDIKKPLMDLLLRDIWEEHKLDRNEYKGLYVDEAWLLADENNQQTMEFLRQIAKRVRKYGGFLTTATQNVDDFLSIGKYGSAIFKNAHFKTFMRLDEKDIEELTKFMTFSEKELKVLGQKKSQGRCIHMASSKRLEMQTKASHDELLIIDPKQAKELGIA